MSPPRNLALGLFGLACVAVSLAVLAGARDWAWTGGSWLGPLFLVGLGILVLVGALTRRR